MAKGTKKKQCKKKNERSNLENVVLQLKVVGIKNVTQFNLMDKPEALRMQKAIAHLIILGALESESHELTKLGKNMAVFPLDVKFSKILISSQKYECSEEILTIVAMLSVDGMYFDNAICVFTKYNHTHTHNKKNTQTHKKTQM